MEKSDELKFTVSLLARYAAKATECAKEGGINLSIGQPEMDPPIEMTNAIKKGMVKGHARYTGIPGSKEMLEKVTQVFHELGYEDVTVKNAIFSHGAKILIDIALRTLCNPDDSVFWFSPGYTYEKMALSNHLNPISIDTQGTSFLPNIEKLKEELEKRRGQNTVVVINNPVNPTSRVWDKKELGEIAEIAKNYPVYFIADETYGDLILGEKHFTPFATLESVKDKTVTIRSGSKELRSPGYRIGYACGPEEVIQKMRILLENCIGCPNTLTQIGAIATILDHKKYADEQIPLLLKKKKIVEDWCQKNSLELAPIEGAFYAFINFENILKKLGLKDTEELVNILLERYKVGITPGKAFGSQLDHQNSYDTWARISIAGPENELIQGLEQIEKVF